MTTVVVVGNCGGDGGDGGNGRGGGDVSQLSW